MAMKLLQGTETAQACIQNDFTSGSILSLLCSGISLYGYQLIDKRLNQYSSCSLILTEYVDEEFISRLFRRQDETTGRNKLQYRYLLNEFYQWLNHESTELKILKLANSSQFNELLLVIAPKGNSFGIAGKVSLTAQGLGGSSAGNMAFNIFSNDPSQVSEFHKAFTELWQSNKHSYLSKDVLNKRIQPYLDDYASSVGYFLSLFHIFNRSLDELTEESIIRSKTGFKDTKVWNKLYRFQRDGVLGAIDKLEKHNGCIIADSVGLGKTFEALAVIRYYELRNDRVLVLCPKRLRENWTIFTINDKRNPLLEDRFNYDVLNHTDLTRTKGKSGEINLETINWANYDLIVIDESHNFRNNDTRSKGKTRYQRLLEDVIKSGVKTKVLMLSATPVNSRMNDIKNQVAFITEGNDLALANYGIANIQNTLKKAQAKFNQWLKLPDEERKTDTLLESINFDYFKLLDSLTIARSRKHIEKYYDASEMGKFPERLQPMNIKADIDLENDFPELEEINKTIKRLTLAAYSPLSFVRTDKAEEYSRKYDQAVRGGTAILRQQDREKSLVHLMRVNILKRMESSINSFTITVDRLLEKVEHQLARLDNSGSEFYDDLSIEDIAEDAPEFEDYVIGDKVKVLIQDLDQHRLRKELEHDQRHLKELLEAAEKISEKRDAKLKRLKDSIQRKIENPLNPGNRKVIVFTAFSDTAEYLYKNLSVWAAESFGVHSALVTGSGTNKTTIKGIPKDLNSLLTYFSPRSKDRASFAPDATEEIDLLIATDCISEGQNLQDCDTLINYDIHWNPVRIIQRFGRIDRLGSTNNAIQLINFWPNMELDEYINLEARVSGRMVLLDVSATGEENLIEVDEARQMNDLEYRRKQLHQLQNTVVDLEDMEGGVSITDLTLNDFRMDLMNVLKVQRSFFEDAPWGLYSACFSRGADTPPGVIFCLMDAKGKVEADDQYGLAPYYLVYVADDGRIVYNHMQCRKSLDAMKLLTYGQTEPDTAAWQQFDAATRRGEHMGHYQGLLEAAIASVMGKTEEKGVQSLFTKGGTALTHEFFRGVDDFEAITYLVVLPREGASLNAG